MCVLGFMWTVACVGIESIAFGCLEFCTNRPRKLGWNSPVDHYRMIHLNFDIWNRPDAERVELVLHWFDLVLVWS